MLDFIVLAIMIVRPPRLGAGWQLGMTKYLYFDISNFVVYRNHTFVMRYPKNVKPVPMPVFSKVY